MESAAVLRSFQCIRFPLKSIIDKPVVVPMKNVGFSSFVKYHVQGFACGGKIISTPNKMGGVTVLCVKTSEAPVTVKCDDLGKSNGAVMSDNSQEESGHENSIRRATFPNGFEALVTEVCDDTEIAELKVKVGDFEMHLKRNIEPPKAPASIESPVVAPPTLSKPMDVSIPAPPAPPKPSAEKISPFTNIPAEKSAKLAALEASGASGYVLVASPTVGSFRRGMTMKGKKQPPIVKDGDVIKQGQTIGYLDQFGTELPVKSDAAGEVLKFLYNDGEAVGYGDPLIAIQPSFRGI